MSFSTSVWDGSTADWSVSADWSLGEPSSGMTDLAALFGGAGDYVVTVSTDIGAIATSGSDASTVGLTVDAQYAFVEVDSGGTLVVGAADGDGGLVTIADGEFIAAGGSFSATSTVTLSGSSASFAAGDDGVADVAALDIAAGSAFISTGGTIAISGALTQTGGSFTFTGSGDFLALGDVNGTATIDLNYYADANSDSRVYWTNSTSTADLAHLALIHFGASNTLDVATGAAVTITGTNVVSNKLTIDTTGGNLVVGLGTGEAAQYFATPAVLGAQNIVRITAGLTTSNWLDANGSGNWTDAADWDDAVPPGGSASNYTAVLGGPNSYTVTVNTDVGAIATSDSTLSTVGLAINVADTFLELDPGGTLVVGAANGDGGLVTMTSGALYVMGGSFGATNTLTLGGSLLITNDGVAKVAALNIASTEAAAVIETGGTLAISGALTQTGGIFWFFGVGDLLALGDVSGTATVDLNYSADANADPDSRVYWTNSATTADLANLTLKDFGTTSTLDVATASAVTITGTNLAANALTIDTTGGNLVVGLGSGGAAQYFATTTTLGSQNVVEITACFLHGTCIATPNGSVAVEDLREGDAVLTRGGALPVQWIGWRDIDCIRHPRPQDVLPVRIDPDAFGPGQPSRTLRLSPDHAVFIDDVLIPVRYLINGATIVQEPRDAVTYWHVELDRHDVILAEGLPCESYLDTGNRSAFANAGAAVQLHPDFARSAESAWREEACAPLVEDGPILATVRAQVAARAAAIRRPLPRLLEIVLAGTGRTTVKLSAEVETIRLVSACGRQGEDRRRLGGLVTGLWVDGVPLGLDDTRLGFGFHELETHGATRVRWTDGAASIAIGRGEAERLIEINIAALIAAPAERRAAA